MTLILLITEYLVSDIAGEYHNNEKYVNTFCTFEVNLLNGLSNALLFALEVRDGGILELEPVLLISLQSQPLWPETSKHTITEFQNYKCMFSCYLFY